MTESRLVMRTLHFQKEIFSLIYGTQTGFQLGIKREDINYGLMNLYARKGPPLGADIREALNVFSEKYNPQVLEKVNQWVPPPHLLAYKNLPLNSIYITEIQAKAVRSIASVRSQSLDQKITVGHVIRSAMEEYFGSSETEIFRRFHERHQQKIKNT